MSTRGRRPIKLSWQQVEEIRLRASKGEPRTQIASFYGVDRSMIWRIVRGLAWKHVEASP